MTRPELVRLRLQLAWETLDEAGWMLEKGHYNTCLNRAYYALFYAANALLETEGLASAKHSGVRSLLFQNFVATGQLPKAFAHAYSTLFEDRQEGDYADLIRFDQPRAEEAIQSARVWLTHLDGVLRAWLEAHP